MPLFHYASYTYIIYARLYTHPSKQRCPTLSSTTTSTSSVNYLHCNTTPASTSIPTTILTYSPEPPAMTLPTTRSISFLITHILISFYRILHQTVTPRPPRIIPASSLETSRRHCPQRKITTLPSTDHTHIIHPPPSPINTSCSSLPPTCS